MVCVPGWLAGLGPTTVELCRLSTSRLEVGASDMFNVEVDVVRAADSTLYTPRPARLPRPHARSLAADKSNYINARKFAAFSSGF